MKALLKTSWDDDTPLLKWKPADINELFVEKDIRDMTKAIIIAGVEIMTAFYGYDSNGELR